MADWLKEASLNIALGFTPAFGRHYSKMETLRALMETHGGDDVKRFPNGDKTNNNVGGDSYTVSGAGSEVVNGIYEYAGTHDSVPMYTKRNGSAPAGTGTLTLYRCALNSGVKRWYISIVQTQTPGTASDIDYYWAGKEVWQGDPVPPKEEWNTCKGAPAGDHSPGALDPPPVVVLNSAESAPVVRTSDVADDVEQMEL